MEGLNEYLEFITRHHQHYLSLLAQQQQKLQEDRQQFQQQQQQVAAPPPPPTRSRKRRSRRSPSSSSSSASPSPRRGRSRSRSRRRRRSTSEGRTPADVVAKRTVFVMNLKPVHFMEEHKRIQAALIQYDVEKVFAQCDASGIARGHGCVIFRSIASKNECMSNSQTFHDQTGIIMKSVDMDRVSNAIYSQILAHARASK
jgi:hypothetical protein